MERGLDRTNICSLENLRCSNKKIVEAFSALKKNKQNEERGNILADEYIKNSSNTLDFLSEIEKFLLLARNSHSYIAKVIQQYFERPNGMSGAEFYGKIVDNLKKLRDSDNNFDHSAKNLLEKANILCSQHSEMRHNLRTEISKLRRKEERVKLCKDVACMIFEGAAVGLHITGLVIVATAPSSVALAPVTVAINSAICVIERAKDWIVSWFEESKRAFENQRELIEERRKETSSAFKYLDDIRLSIDRVINQIDSITYNPGSEMDEEQLDFTMKQIKSKLGAFLNKVEDLENDVENTIRFIRKARDDVIS